MIGGIANFTYVWTVEGWLYVAAAIDLFSRRVMGWSMSDEVCLCAAVFGLVILSSPALAGAPEGVWLSQDGGTKVHLARCGGKLCGTVVWLEKPIDIKTGKPKTDTQNPDPAKRSRPLLGLQVVHGLAPSGSNKWSGLIYNADDGNTYSAHMIPDGDTAKVQGCVLGFLCKTQNWKRAN